MKTFLLFLLFYSYNTFKISKGLKKELSTASEGKKFFAIVSLSASYPYQKLKNYPLRSKVKIFQKIAERAQERIFILLRENFKEGKDFEIKSKFWVFNGFHILAKKEVIYFLSKLQEVRFIEENREIFLDWDGQKRTKDIEVFKRLEWNISRVRADSCWSEGYTGVGAIVGHIDTGVDTSHPALKGKFISPYWFDAVNGLPNPYDDLGHGTHTMGTILGGDGSGPFSYDIGVAPDARFVTCKAFNNEGIGLTSWIDAAMQKIAEWKGIDGLDIIVCSNSWGAPGGETHFWSAVATWKSLGILPVFSAGNMGPNQGTMGSPGDYPLTLSVGAVDISDYIANFSSRGPAPNFFPYNDTSTWYYQDWNYLKPDISAPGVGIFSSVPGGGYSAYNGTSMAAPHAAGAACILYQKNKFLTPDELFSYIVFNTRQVQQGAPYPNNNYGWGILNIYKALKAVPPDTFPFLVLTPYFEDANLDSIWNPGETLYVKIKMKNKGNKIAFNVNAKLRVISDYAYVIDSFSSFGDIAPLDSSDNFSSPFIIYSSADPLAEGIFVDIILDITYNTDIQVLKSYKLLIGQEGRDYADHNCGNIILTVTRYGNIGYMSINRTKGSGCIYPKTGTSLLYFGAFAVGTQYPYVIDNYYENGGIDGDWVTVYPPDGKVHMFQPAQKSTQFSRAIFEDLNGEEIKGVRVIQRGYSFDSPGLDDFVILEYIIKNKTLQQINGLYAGIFLDWDIDENTYYMNKGGVDGQRSMVYMNYYTLKYMGGAILRPPRNSSLIRNLSLINNPTYVYPTNGLPDTYEIQFLNGTLSFSSADSLDDWSTVLSTGPFFIPGGDSIIVAFAIAGGNSLSELQEAIDSAYVKYWEITSVTEDFINKDNFKVLFFNPLKNNTLKFISSSSFSSAKFSVFDISGRRVFCKMYRVKKGLNIITFKKILPSSVYIVNIETPHNMFKQRIIMLRR